MSSFIVRNSLVILEHGTHAGGVIIENERIAGIFSDSDTPAGFSRSESIDLEGAYLAPGLIDIHIHGSAGVDVQAADEAALENLSAFLLSEGVTGYFATVVPTDERGYVDALANIRSYIERQAGSHQSKAGARILGIHFEGPFVSEHRCGALQRRHFRSYDGDPRSIELFTGQALDGNSRSVARLMTLAPELHGGVDLIRELRSAGVRVFIGHTQADPQVLDLAVEAGACHMTHFPNALEPLHHRKPGAVAWGLVRDDVTFDCIADFHHVHPLMLRLMLQSKGAERIALISDAIKPAGLGDGDFSVWGDQISVRDGKTTLAREPGTLAGSVITMRQAVRNVAGLGVPVHEAVRMATLVPARVAGIEQDSGSIKEGKRADLIAFDDNLTMRLAVLGGEAHRP